MPGLRDAVLHCTAAVLLATAGQATAAQQPGAPEDPPPPDHLYTLRVYADLLQLPALVIDPQGAPVRDLNAKSFELRLDAGPPFRPSAVHAQGQDPLSLAFVIDASGAQKELLHALPSTRGHGLPSTLLPHDHVSTYAIDCRSLRSADDMSAETALQRNGVADLLNDPTLHKTDAGKPCRETKRLWDLAAYAVSRLAETPGRRALLLITDGEDRGSKMTPEILRHFATSKSVAVFVLRQAVVSPASVLGRGFAMLPASSALNDLELLSTGTGGLILPTDRDTLAAGLDRFVTLLRSRYILQFPRPANERRGEHQIEVRVPNRGDTVLTAGTSAPLRDPTLLNDPNTVPADKSKMPVLGDRKPQS